MSATPAVACGTNTEHSPSPRPVQNVSTWSVMSTTWRRDVSTPMSVLSTTRALGRAPSTALDEARVLGLDAGAEPLDDLTLGRHEELLEVPLDVAGGPSASAFGGELVVDARGGPGR